MRVIAGSARGTKLISPDGFEVRPTIDRVKEDLFNIISFNVVNSNFLDLFSGTGSIGIEALSRGARLSTFVDNSKNSRDIINSNLCKTNLKDKSVVLGIDVLNDLNTLKNRENKFDIIFMDPPYEKGFVAKTLKNIIDLKLLNVKGIIICEQFIKEEIPCFEKLCIFKIKKYKTTKMTFLRYN